MKSKYFTQETQDLSHLPNIGSQGSPEFKLQQSPTTWIQEIELLPAATYVVQRSAFGLTTAAALSCRKMPHLIFFGLKRTDFWCAWTFVVCFFVLWFLSKPARTGEYQKQGEAVGEGTYGTVWKVGADSLKLRLLDFTSWIPTPPYPVWQIHQFLVVP